MKFWRSVVFKKQDRKKTVNEKYMPGKYSVTKLYSQSLIMVISTEARFFTVKVAESRSE